MSLALRMIAFASATLILAGCNSPDRVVRYRFTVEVEDNGALRTGEAVQEKGCAFNDGIFKGLGNALNCSVKGEAVVIDLGDKGALFVLLTRDNTNRESIEPFLALVKARSDLVDRDLTSESMGRLTKARGASEFPLDCLPLLARFRNPSDPKTVERVDPGNLAASFGDGVSLKRATIEVTRDPLTTGIEKRLPWLVAPHVLSGIVEYHGPLAATGTLPFMYELNYDYFWRLMQ
jgi:hypothetical protein